MQKTLEIFFCYAREDEALRQGLENQLRALRRQGVIDLWHDRNISAGTEWEREIDRHLNTAQVILLLVSPDFLDSDYCYSVEMKRAMERHERGEARVIPVILRPVYWQKAPFGKLQALPTDAKPVTSSQWYSLDEAFFDVAEGIRTAVEELVARDEAEQWRDQGERHYNQRHYVQALAASEQALRLDPNYALAYYNKGWALYDLQRYEEALAAYEQTIRLDSNNARAYISKSTVLNDLGRHQEALVASSEAIRLDPNSAVAYYEKGDSLYHLALYKEAVIAFEQVVRLADPSNLFVGLWLPIDASASVIKSAIDQELKHWLREADSSERTQKIEWLQDCREKMLDPQAVEEERKKAQELGYKWPRSMTSGSRSGLLNYYAVLYLEENASSLEIQQALARYRISQQKALNNPLTMSLARSAINEIVPAIEQFLLSDDNTRIEYDLQLAIEQKRQLAGQRIGRV